MNTFFVPSVVVRALLFGGLFAACLPSPCAGQAAPNDAPQKPAPCAVWPVPPDFITRRNSQESPAADPSDSPAEANAAKPSKRYAHIIPALGTEPPWDARPVLEDLGVAFRDGDIALCSAETDRTPLLFVRAEQEQLDLLETICGQMMGSGPSQHGMVTFHLRRRLADGSVEELVERSFICRAGQRAIFKRHRGEKLLEQEEVELTVGEDGATMDVNSAVEFMVEDRKVTAAGQTLLHNGDADGLLLCAVADKTRGASLEVQVAAKVLRLPPLDESPTQPGGSQQLVAQEINRMLIALESPQTSQVKFGDLHCYPFLLTSLPAPDSPTAPEATGERIEIKLPQYHVDALLDVRKQLLRLKVPLQDGDSAWYHPGTGILYAHAAEPALALLAGQTADQYYPLGGNQLHVSFASWEEKPERVEFATRVGLVRTGQKFSSTSEATGQKPESIEFEVWAEGSHPAADLNMSLGAFNMGDETWTLNAQARTLSDGTAPVTLASGMAKDTGGSRKFLTVSSKLRWHLALDLARDPARKATAIKDIEAALKAVGR